jgi:hypothetical protein
VTKAEVHSQLIDKLAKKIAVLKSALADSEESASGAETKSEGKYDTRAIEAAYLAQAQAEQLSLAKESLGKFRRFVPPPYDLNDEIGPGALVEVEQDGEICFYFLAPTGGGLVTDYLGCEVTVVTPKSRMYQQLEERKLGDTLDEMSVTVMGLE